MKKKLLIIVLLLVLLITSFFVLTKKPNIKHKKLKELNYNLTYKQAFPDENLRRSVVLCIMRDRCNNNGYNYFKETNYAVDNSNYLTDTRLGPVITEAELEAKEEEQLSKQALDKLEYLVANNMNKQINSLQGIEYLLNIKSISLNNIQTENIDLSSNKELKYLKIRAIKANSINLDQNLKLENVELYLSPNEIYLI